MCCNVMLPWIKTSFLGPEIRRVCRLLVWIYVVIVTVTCQDSGDYPPTSFSSEPVGGSPTLENGYKVLICRSSSLPVPEYTWLKDDRTITNASQAFYSYRLGPLTRDSAGLYRCIASNKMGAILSSAANVEVAYMDQFDGVGQTFNLPVSEGGSLVIPLPNIDSFPAPTLTWKEEGLDMGPEGAKHQVLLNGSLVLLDRDMPANVVNKKNYAVEGINGNAGIIEVGPTYAVTVTSVSGLGTRLPPTLVIAPQHVTVAEDSDKAEFECVFNARPVGEVLIKWFRVEDDGTRTPITTTPDNKYLFSLFARTLTIKGPKPTDNGVYQCAATLTGFSDTVVVSANLTVHTSPTFASQFLPSELIRDFGQMVTMNCQAKGYPPPDIVWYYNAREIFKDYNSSSYTLHPNNSLTISQLDLEHAGMYQCFIRNAAGEASKSTWLRVNSSPPRMVTPPADLTVVEQTEARMTCETKGAPKPVVTWKKTTASGVVDVLESGRIRILPTGELFFVFVLSADSATYTCNASNSKGHIAASASLNVYVKTEISRPPQDKQVAKGATAIFECGVSHDPGIVVTWQWVFRSRQTEEVIVNDMLRTVYPNGTLEIRSCGSSDIGDYTCFVASDGGNDNRTVSLAVIELPGPPVIQSVRLHPTDVRGVVVTWNPTYDGNTPILKFSIQYKETTSEAGDTDNSVWVTYSTNISATVRSTKVTGLKPARFYQFRVLASNVVGEGGPSLAKPDVPIEMPQQPPSAPPKGFFGVSATNRSVRLGWQPPDESNRNGPLLGYVIKYKPANYPDTSIQKVRVTNGTNILVNPRYELFGLDFFTEYQIQIAAFNAKGDGVYSSPIRVWTLEGHPTEAPKSLQATAVNSTSIALSWTPPSPQFIHGVNLGYKVFYRRRGVLEDDRVKEVKQDVSNPIGEQTTTLTNLLKYTEYSVTVLCFTTQGDGPKTTPPVVQRTAEDVPSMVGNLTFKDIRHTSLKVDWTAPAQPNGILTGYTLMYEEKNKTDTRKVISLPAQINSYTIFKLTAMTQYTVHVFASTKVGDGPTSSADIRSGVPPKYPDAPCCLGVSNIEGRSVLLQFTPGFDGHTSITLWIVEALEGLGATTPKQIYNVSAPGASSITVQNLKPYTYYKLRIIAMNIVGPSNPSNWTEDPFQTKQEAPTAPPGSVTVRALNATALRISWTPLSTEDWNGNPKGYKLYYRRENVTDWTLQVLTNSEDSAILAGLQQWNVYHVKMLSYNDVGNSDFSPITMERTKESVPSKGPDNVSAYALSSTSINVTWGDVPALDQNGMIQGFKVEFSSPEANIQRQFLDVPGNTTRSATIKNLRKYVEYIIRVLAYTRMGDGVLSSKQSVVRTLPDVPGPPVKVWFPEVGYTFATIEWAEPNEPNGIITGYMVSYRVKGSGDEFVNSTVLPPGSLHYEVTGLQKQAYYVFRVRAKTHFDQQYNGWGETASVEVLTMTNRSEPNSPGKPSIVQSQVKARSVTISWIPAPFNGYGPLRNFTVQYKRTGHQWTDVRDPIMPTETIYSVEGLRPSTVYVFRIAATNDVGMSPYSVQSEAQKTLEDYPEGAPQNVHVERLTRTSVRITWDEPIPTTWNGQLLGYKISYRQVEHSSYLEEIVPISEERSRTFTGLVKFVNYEFLVNAWNSVGPGPTSTPITVFVGEAAPTASPLNINATATSLSEIFVTWTPPPPETHNGALSGYKITYWLKGLPPQLAKQFIVRELTALLTNLDTYSEYAISVQAYNLAGEGPKSPPTYAKTLEGLPDAPAGITFWNVTYTSLDVHWYAPNNPNGRIVNYNLTYVEQSIDGGTKRVTFYPPGNSTKKTINELVPNTSYLFFVSARTSLGEGNRTSMAVKTGPQPGSPGRPKNIVLQRNYKDQKMILSWDENENTGDTAIWTHFIEANNTATNEGWKKILQVYGKVTQAEISLLMLMPDAEYKLRVESMNYNGISPYSDPSEKFKTAAPAEEEPEVPFHYQPWFLVIVGLTCVIILLIVGSLLCLISRKGKPRQKKAGPTASTTNLTPTPEPEEGGFGNFEMTRQSTNRRHKFAGIRNGTANSIYARPPPRPSPASVAYSDDDGASAVKPPLPDDDDDDDDSSSNCTDKPSQLGDSSNPSDVDTDSDDSIEPPLPPPPPPPSSPPPPPFSDVGRSYNPDPASQSWQNQNPNNNSSFNAYQYTDSEAESSHYAFSLNGGQILLNNTAGSRAPLPGFSSFV